MPVQLIALDLDDTLLTSRLTISPRTRAVLKRLRKQGIKLTLATGRMFRSARPYAEELEMDVPLITYQGALVKSALSGEIFYEKPVPPADAAAVIERVKARGLHYQTYFCDNLYMERLSAEGKAYADLSGVEPVIDPALAEKIKTGRPTKLIVINNRIDQLLSFEAALKTEFGIRLHITRSKPNFLEIMHPEATKGLALASVAAHYGIPREDILAIGDSYNDLDMLEWAGIGVAVANAWPEVKAAADYVTGTNDEDGVADALERLVFTKE